MHQTTKILLKSVQMFLRYQDFFDFQDDDWPPY